MDEPTWMQVARGELGVHETPGPASTARILDYHNATTLKATSDEVPWCAAFASWCLEQAGVPSTRSAAARSYMTWGKALSSPRPGCVVVLRRGSNPAQGHVAFFVKRQPGADHVLLLLGGNQGDKVCISHYPEDYVLGYRWPAAPQEA